MRAIKRDNISVSRWGLCLEFIVINAPKSPLELTHNVLLQAAVKMLNVVNCTTTEERA